MSVQIGVTGWVCNRTDGSVEVIAEGTSQQLEKLTQFLNSKNYISDCKRRAAEKTDFSFAIIINKNIVGRIGLHHINYPNRIAEIGYWLADGLQGKGIMHQCCKALINHAFTALGLNRIEIKCGIGNDKSRAIAEKLQFKQEGILRQAELLNGKFIDLYLYAMLKDEWHQINP